MCRTFKCIIPYVFTLLLPVIPFNVTASGNTVPQVSEETKKFDKELLDFYLEANKKYRADKPAINYPIGFIRQRMGDEKRAEANFKLSVSLSENWHLPHLALARLYEGIGKTALAKKEFQTFFRLSSDYPIMFETLVDLGIRIPPHLRPEEKSSPVYKETPKGFDKDLLAFFKKAEDLYPGKKAEIHYHVGMIRLRAGETTKAEESLKNAASLSPEWHFPCLALARLYEDRDEKLKAREQYIKFFSIFPGKSMIFAALNGKKPVDFASIAEKITGEADSKVTSGGKDVKETPDKKKSEARQSIEFEEKVSEAFDIRAKPVIIEPKGLDTLQMVFMGLIVFVLLIIIVFAVLLKMTPTKTRREKRRRSPEPTKTKLKKAEAPVKAISEIKPSSKPSLKEEKRVKKPEIKKPAPVESDFSMLPVIKDELAELDHLKLREATIDSDLRRLWSRISS